MNLVILFRLGLFFFSVADQGDLLIAQLSEGRVEVLFDFGTFTRNSISAGVALNDGVCSSILHSLKI